MRFRVVIPLAEPGRAARYLLASLMAYSLAFCTPIHDRGPGPVGSRSASEGEALQAAVTDFVAPVDGGSTHGLLRLLVWIERRRVEYCGAAKNGILMSEGDRYDQVLFPDFRRIASNGIGVLENYNAAALRPTSRSGARAKELSSARPADELTDHPAFIQCWSGFLPEMTAAESAQTEWLSSVVHGIANSEIGSRRANIATLCLRRDLGLTDRELPSLKGFFEAIDGLAAAGASLPAEQFQQHLRKVDRDATAAFLHCTRSFYAWLSGQLATARTTFLKRYRPVIKALSVRLDTLGFRP